MKYTQLSAEVNNKVQEHLDVVKEEILKAIPNTISIILYGGFGRGEGSVKVVGKDVMPANDYDIYVITKKRVDDEILDGIAKTVAKRLGKKGIEFHSFSKEQTIKDSFYLDLKCLTTDQLRKLFPMIRYYELRNSTTIIYGEDVRKLIPDYHVNDIPLAEGIRILLNRMTHLVEYLSLEGKHDEEVLAYFCAKAYIDSCTALLILSRKYVPYYRERAEIFSKNYKEDFPELYKKFPDLDKKILKYTKWKLNFNGLPEKDVMKFWYESRQSIFEVTKYYIGKCLNIEINDEEDLSRAIRAIGGVYYTPYLKIFLKDKFGISYGASLMRPCLNLYFKFLYFLRLKEKKIYSRIFLNLNAPDLLIFSALPYIIFALNSNGVDNLKLKKGIDILNKVYPVKGKSWEEVSQDYADAYVLFFLQKIV